MYKMKEVCQLTGLTEKTVRFYVDQKLVTPKTESGLHYKSYRFDDADIQRLKDISALRGAEFSVADIRRMLETPSAIPELLARKEESLADKISTLQTVRGALETLTVAERTNLTQVADAVESRTPLRRETPRHNRLLWIGIYLGVFFLLGFVLADGKKIWLMGIALTLLAGVSFPVMAWSYLRYNRRHRKLPRRGTARVIGVVSDEGVNDYWEETEAETLYGLMNVGFFHWNWVRPDHWVPLIQFETEGEVITTAYRYGWLKNSWHAGDTVEVAWNPGKETRIFPCGDPVIFRKTWSYLAAGIAFLVLFFLLCFTL